MEYPASGFHDTHGWMPDEGVWYHSGTRDVPLTITSKRYIALSIVELIKIAMEAPERLPEHVRISGTHRTPRKIVDIVLLAKR